MSVIHCRWVTGWGLTSEGGRQAEVLQELELTAVDDATCYTAMTGALGTYWGQTFAQEQVRNFESVLT